MLDCTVGLFVTC